MYLLTEWEVRTEKYLARGRDVRTKRIRRLRVRELQKRFHIKSLQLFLRFRIRQEMARNSSIN